MDSPTQTLQEGNGIQKYQQPLVLRIMATIVSYVFHPAFMPVIMTLVLYRLAPASFAGVTQKNIGIILLRVAYLTAFFPLLTVVLLKGLGFISSFQMKDPKERIIPLIGTMIFYFWAYRVFKNIDSPFILRVMLLGCFWGVISVFMINIFFKISMHTSAAGSMIGILMILLFLSPVNLVLPFFLALLVAGLIGTARMILSAHRSGELWLGYITGILVQVAAYLYLK